MPQHFIIKSAFIEKGLERKGLGLYMIVQNTTLTKEFIIYAQRSQLTTSKRAKAIVIDYFD